MNVNRDERTTNNALLRNDFSQSKLMQKKKKKYYHKPSNNNSKLLELQNITIHTCYLGGDAGGDGRAKALVRGGFEGEEVGGPWVETYEQVMRLVPQLEHPSPLGCQVSTGVQ